MLITINVSDATLTFEYPVEMLFTNLPQAQQEQAHEIIREALERVLFQLTNLLVGTMELRSLSVALLLVLSTKISETSRLGLEFDAEIKSGRSAVEVYAEYCQQQLLKAQPEVGKVFKDFIDGLDLSGLDGH